MSNTTTERLPIARHAIEGADRASVAVAREGTDARGLALSVRAVLVCRASRAARLAQRARTAGNEGRARRLATVARDWAGLDPVKG